MDMSIYYTIVRYLESIKDDSNEGKKDIKANSIFRFLRSNKTN